MTRFHINPETGVPGRCKATISCRFGDINTDHYGSADKARAAYETSQASNTLAGAKKSSTLPLPAYPAYLTPELIAKIPRAADGTTFEENWAARFEVLTHANYNSVESYLRNQLGNPDFGRPRGSLEAVWLVPSEFGRYEYNPAHPNEVAGVYPYEAKPENGQLMAQIYTRNGGGNR